MLANLTEGFDFKWVKMGLDATSMRHKTIANNIANVNTPTYNRQFVSFESQLKKAVEKRGDITGKITRNGHIPIAPIGISYANPEVKTEENTSMRGDENNIDIDKEMADLAKNNLMNQFLIKRLNFQFTEINTAIQRGARA